MSEFKEKLAGLAGDFKQLVQDVPVIAADVVSGIGRELGLVNLGEIEVGDTVAVKSGLQGRVVNIEPASNARLPNVAGAKFTDDTEYTLIMTGSGVERKVMFSDHSLTLVEKGKAPEQGIEPY